VSVPERTIGSRVQLYVQRRAAFNRRRRKNKIHFDKLYRLFASDLSFEQIAETAGVSRARLRDIFNLHFKDLFGVTGLERRREREKRRRDETLSRVARLISQDPVLKAIKASAAKAKRRRTIEPIVLDRRGEPIKRYRHRAVLIDGKHVEPVHHIRNARVFSRGGLAYGTTSLSRRRLEDATWIILCVDVPNYRRRVIRSKSARLLKAAVSEKRKEDQRLHPA
jgi:AraC-like DNA-binding protein